MNRRRMTGHRVTAAASATPDPLADVAAYWKFEGVSLNTLDDAIGTRDLLLNSTTNVTWTAGKHNNAFTHTTNTNSRFFGIETPGTILDPSNNGSESQAFSFSVWQKLAIASFAAPASPMSPALAICGNGALWSWFLWREYHAGNYATAKFATREPGGVVDTIEGTGLSYGDSLWHHYCVTRATGASSAMRLYVDGTLVASGTSTGLANVTTGTNAGFSIGSITASGQQLTAINRNLGQTDEAGYWNRALTAAEVAYLYNAGAGNFLP